MTLDSLWTALEEFSATSFLIAGAILIIFAALLGLEALLDITTPDAVFGTAGYVFAFIGLLGLFRQTAADNLWLARASALFALLGAVGAALASISMLGVNLGLLGEEIPAWGMVPIALHGIGMVLGYLSFGIASLRSEEPSRTVALLLLAPPFIFAVMFASAASGLNPLIPFGLASIQALLHLALGALLRGQFEPALVEGTA
jgi:hypothetical protein